MTNTTTRRKSKWIEIPPSAIRYDRWSAPRNTSLKGVGGVYALFCNSELVYIGSAVRLDERLREHIRGYGMCGDVPGYHSYRRKQVLSARWTIKVRPARFYGDWATIELRLIRRLSPRFNAISRGQSVQFA